MPQNLVVILRLSTIFTKTYLFTEERFESAKDPALAKTESI